MPGSCYSSHLESLTVQKKFLDLIPLESEFGLVSLPADQLSNYLETSGLIIYADLPNLRASESPPSTIPVSLVTTTARPDMAIIDGNVVTLLEMTIPIKQENLNRTIFLCLVIFKRAGILLS